MPKQTHVQDGGNAIGATNSRGTYNVRPVEPPAVTRTGRKSPYIDPVGIKALGEALKSGQWIAPLEPLDTQGKARDTSKVFKVAVCEELGIERAALAGRVWETEESTETAPQWVFALALKSGHPLITQS